MPLQSSPALALDGFDDDWDDEYLDDDWEEDPSLPLVTHPDEFYQLDDNPLNPVGDNLDLLIQTQINQDLWAAMMGDLPCLEPTTECIRQLQEMAVGNNLGLTIIQERIDGIDQRIDEARSRNQSAVWMDTFEPLMSRYLTYEQVMVGGRPQQRGFFDRLLSAVSNPFNAINEALSLIGIPLIRGATQTNARAQQTAIAISDLQVKVAQIEQEKRKIAETIREQVALELLEFDATRREFQISQEIARRATVQHRLLEIDYRFGTRIDSVTYLGRVSQLDQAKASTYRAWARLRTRLARIQMLVVGSD
ncbi:hypothetical protein [Nodosilinea sp. P-1105]|uniref:hypothetical protein n=1 Tax=Nodosilinea sp. P-1105 TaxID=2546229 RepID=UPI00146E06A4|nr:hypothetical protein [Nodosilinea sp. P-1105]NMF86306.1 hypothetical protein [Nodosilinea sp. P-1105]